MVKTHVTQGDTMEDKNELNDIILNKGGASAGSKKLLLAIATMTLILIIVLVVMNSLKNNEVQKAPKAIVPPTPTAPTEIINDPLFEPVEVIQEGQESNNSGQGEDLAQVAQKIKDESLKNTPTNQNITSNPVVPVATPAKTVVQSVPAVEAKPAKAVVSQKVTAAAVVKTAKPVEKTVLAQPVKHETTKIAQPTIAPKQAVVPTKVEAPKSEPKASTASANNGTYYIQVGSFSKEPDKALFDRLNASGMKYTTQKSGEISKILVGPFQGEKAVQDAMGNIRQNIEAKAFKIKG
jgi:DedD protein